MRRISNSSLRPFAGPVTPYRGVHQHLRPGHPPGNTLAALLGARLRGPQQPTSSDQLGTEQPGAPGAGLLPPLADLGGPPTSRHRVDGPVGPGPS